MLVARVLLGIKPSACSAHSLTRTRRCLMHTCPRESARATPPLAWCAPLAWHGHTTCKDRRPCAFAELPVTLAFDLELVSCTALMARCVRNVGDIGSVHSLAFMGCTLSHSHAHGRADHGTKQSHARSARIHHRAPLMHAARSASSYGGPGKVSQTRLSSLSFKLQKRCDLRTSPKQACEVWSWRTQGLCCAVVRQ